MEGKEGKYNNTILHGPMFFPLVNPEIVLFFQPRPTI